MFLLQLNRFSTGEANLVPMSLVVGDILELYPASLNLTFS